MTRSHTGTKNGVGEREKRKTGTSSKAEMDESETERDKERGKRKIDTIEPEQRGGVNEKKKKRAADETGRRQRRGSGTDVSSIYIIHHNSTSIQGDLRCSSFTLHHL